MEILLVDDHVLFVAGLKAMLQNRGFSVVGTAGDGFEAVEKVRVLRPDVVLMDNCMPRCTGLEALRLIKAEFPQVRVVMLTTSSDDDTLLEAINSGASGFIVKTTGVEEFFELLSGIRNGQAAITRGIATRLMSALARSSQQAASMPAARGQKMTKTSRALTAHQTDILRRISQGDTYKQIAQALSISERTVNYHIAEILDKLQVQNRSQAIAYATHHGLIEESSADDRMRLRA